MPGRDQEGESIKTGWSTFSAGYVFLVLSLALPLSLFIAAAWYARTTELRLAEERVAAFTNTLAGHARATLQGIDLLLARVSDKVEGKSWDEIRDSRELHEFLVGLRTGLPQVESVFLVGPDGWIAASSRGFPPPAFNGREREYFKGAEERKTNYISAAFRGNAQGTLAFTVSRSLFHGGAFNGVVAVTVSPGYFEDFYRNVSERSGVSTAVLVRQSDASLLVRYPDNGRLPDRLPPETPLLRAVAASNGNFGLFTGTSSLDGHGRIGAFARLDQYGVLVNYNVDRDAVLAKWHMTVAVFAVFAILGGLALFVTARLMLAKASRQQEHLRLLLAETGRRQEAEAKLQHSQKMEALGRLTGGVAHDFNNLLAAILGGIDMARKRIEEPNAIRLLGMAAEAAERGAKLTKQMLAFSRKEDVAFRSVQANDVLRGMDELLRRTIGGLIRIRYDLASDAWPILVDPVQLEVAILNLAVNARDAMPFGGDLTLSTRNIHTDARSSALPLDAGDYVMITVADSGQGMTEEVKQKAFEPFFTTKPAGQGTGLGLSMVFGLTASARGTAIIDSAADRGTRVSLYLRRAAALPEASEAAGGGDALQVGRPLRVLVVDDNSVVCNLAREMLQEAGHIAECAESGREALEKLQQDRDFDLLIADYAMPSMNGSQLAAEAVKLHPSLAILFMTGYVEHDALRTWLDRGYRMLSKPFTAKELEIAVQGVAGARPPANVVSLRTARSPKA
jgi:signal transduction histidine kinase/ActR/RegA family two-component response regulator